MISPAMLQAVSCAEFAKAEDNRLRAKYPGAHPRFHVSFFSQFLAGAVAAEEERAKSEWLEMLNCESS